MNTAARTDRSHVLVTGAAGYVGSHIVNQLLAQGYSVRAAVRTPARADDVRRTVAAGGFDADAVEFVYADLGSDEGWADAVAGTRYVMHVASPFPAANPRTDDEVITPARDGALRVLREARDAGCTRVVMTSSFAAVGYSPRANHPWTEQVGPIRLTTTPPTSGPRPSPNGRPGTSSPTAAHSS